MPPWLLGVYDVKDDATLAEQIISTVYGIPTTFWNETFASRTNRGDDQTDL